MIIQFLKQFDEIQSTYLAMNRLVFHCLLLLYWKQQNAQSMKAVITEERCIDIY